VADSRAGGTTALYLCYLSLEDPLAWTQVVAYLSGLAERGHTIHLLSWEPKGVTAQRRREIESELGDRGITWHTLPYHKRPSLPATIYDVLRGVVRAYRLIKRHDIELLHARSHVPAAVALVLARLRGRKLVFDLRGLMAEEFVDAGRWKQGGLPFRITKRVERAALDRADGIVVLTERVRAQLFGDATDSRVQVIPCCADLASIEAQHGRRREIRERLGIEDRTVMLYLGKFTGWYLEGEMAEFFRVAGELLPELHFLVVTQADPRLITDELSSRAAAPSRFTVTQVSPAEVGSYLAAADFGISFILPAPSKVSSSPTKIGEYLGAGLPIVCGHGIGDVDPLLHRHRVGVVLDDFQPDAYRAATEDLRALLADPDTPKRCRQAAHSTLSLSDVGIPAYDRLYRTVAAGARK
jgi:glycosyltransferase involved in cell wall biosynthesis